MVLNSKNNKIIWKCKSILLIKSAFLVRKRLKNRFKSNYDPWGVIDRFGFSDDGGLKYDDDIEKDIWPVYMENRYSSKNYGLNRIKKKKISRHVNF